MRLDGFYLISVLIFFLSCPAPSSFSAYLSRTTVSEADLCSCNQTAALLLFRNVCFCLEIELFVFTKREGNLNSWICSLTNGKKNALKWNLVLKVELEADDVKNVYVVVDWLCLEEKVVMVGIRAPDGLYTGNSGVTNVLVAEASNLLISPPYSGSSSPRWINVHHLSRA